MSICVSLLPIARIETEVDTLERELLELSFTPHPEIQHLTNLQEQITMASQELAVLPPNDIDPGTLHDIKFKLRELAVNLAYYHAKATGQSPHHAMAVLREFYVEADDESEVHA